MYCNHCVLLAHTFSGIWCYCIFPRSNIVMLFHGHYVVPLNPWCCYNVGYTQKYILTQLSHDVVFSYPISRLPNRFETLHRARQWYCRALCKISKRYDNPNISNGGAMIRETWVDESRDESQRGIFLLQHLPVGALMAPGQNLQNGIHLIMVIGQWHLRVSQGWHMAIQNIRTS